MASAYVSWLRLWCYMAVKSKYPEVPTLSTNHKGYLFSAAVDWYLSMLIFRDSFVYWYLWYTMPAASFTSSWNHCQKVLSIFEHDAEFCISVSAYKAPNIFQTYRDTPTIQKCLVYAQNAKYASPIVNGIMYIYIYIYIYMYIYII